MTDQPLATASDVLAHQALGAVGIAGLQRRHDRPVFAVGALGFGPQCGGAIAEQADQRIEVVAQPLDQPAVAAGQCDAAMEVGIGTATERLGGTLRALQIEPRESAGPFLQRIERFRAADRLRRPWAYTAAR